MYRDDLEALRARLTTVEAELRAEKQHRAAAEAKMQAARAAADEEKVRARLAGEDTKVTRISGYWHNWRTLVLIGTVAGLVLAVGYFIHVATSGPELSAPSTEMAVKLDTARKQIEELKRITQTQGLELRRMSGRLQRPSVRDKSPSVQDKSPSARDKSPAFGIDKADPLREQKLKLVQSAQQAYVAENYSQAIIYSRQLLKLHAGHYKAIQIIGASSCYLKDLPKAQWAYDQVSPSFRPLLRKVCLNNGVPLKDR
jgi:hypothetical protein